MAAAGTCGTGTRSTGSMVAAASTNNVTSFQRRGPRASGADSGCSRLVSIAGTRPSVRNGQLLVSTGLPALDQLLDFNLASLITQRVKYPPVMPETQEKRVRSLDWEDPLEKEMATRTNILARRIPWTEESIGLQAMESQRVEYH